jgi:hypothetical protein
MINRGAILGLAIVVAGAGCSSLNNTENGALAGGAAGALIGGAIGSDHHHTGTGAALGGLIGAGTGALVGHAADQDEKRAKEAAAAASAPVRGPLSLEDIITMAKSGTSDALIINQIRTTGSRYNLTSDMIIYLQQNNISQAVITEMQNTAYRPMRVVREPVYVRDPYYYGPVYVAPPPPAISFGYTRFR